MKTIIKDIGFIALSLFFGSSCTGSITTRNYDSMLSGYYCPKVAKHISYILKHNDSCEIGSISNNSIIYRKGNDLIYIICGKNDKDTFTLIDENKKMPHKVQY